MGKTDVRINFIYNAFFQLSNILIPIITTPYLTRVLYAQGIGKYAYAYSVSYIFYIFTKLGLQNYGNRSIAYVRDDACALKRTFWSIYSFQAFMGVAVTTVYIIYCVYLADDKVLSTIFGMMVIAGGLDVTWALYGLEEFKISSIRDVIAKIVTALLIFIFVKNVDDVWKYALIYCAGFLVCQIITVPIVLGRVGYCKPKIEEVTEHIKPNIILFLPTIAVMIYKNMDKIMIGAIASDTELGYYHSCENIIMVPLALITALGTVMLPRMSNMESLKVERKQIENLFDKSINFSMFVSTAVCFGIMTVANEFVPLFFGEGFESCISIFNIILPSCLFLAFANVIRTQYLMPKKKDNIYIVSLFIGAIINLIINFILIPRYASKGAAMGTLITEATVCFVQASYVYKDAHIWRNIVNSIPFFIAGVSMYIVFGNYTVDVSNEMLALLLKICISGSFYIIVLILVGGFKRIQKKFNT